MSNLPENPPAGIWRASTETCGYAYKATEVINPKRDKVWEEPWLSRSITVLKNPTTQNIRPLLDLENEPEEYNQFRNDIADFVRQPPFEGKWPAEAGKESEQRKQFFGIHASDLMRKYREAWNIPDCEQFVQVCYQVARSRINNLRKNSRRRNKQAESSAPVPSNKSNHLTMNSAPPPDTMKTNIYTDSPSTIEPTSPAILENCMNWPDPEIQKERVPLDELIITIRHESGIIQDFISSFCKDGMGISKATDFHNIDEKRIHQRISEAIAQHGKFCYKLVARIPGKQQDGTEVSLSTSLHFLARLSWMAKISEVTFDVLPDTPTPVKRARSLSVEEQLSPAKKTKALCADSNEAAVELDIGHSSLSNDPPPSENYNKRESEAGFSQLDHPMTDNNADDSTCPSDSDSASDVPSSPWLSRQRRSKSVTKQVYRRKLNLLPAIAKSKSPNAGNDGQTEIVNNLSSRPIHNDFSNTRGLRDTIMTGISAHAGCRNDKDVDQSAVQQDSVMTNESTSSTCLQDTTMTGISASANSRGDNNTEQPMVPEDTVMASTFTEPVAPLDTTITGVFTEPYNIHDDDESKPSIVSKNDTEVLRIKPTSPSKFYAVYSQKPLCITTNHSETNEMSGPEADIVDLETANKILQGSIEKNDDSIVIIDSGEEQDSPEQLNDDYWIAKLPSADTVSREDSSLDKGALAQYKSAAVSIAQERQDWLDKYHETKWLNANERNKAILVWVKSQLDNFRHDDQIHFTNYDNLFNHGERNFGNLEADNGKDNEQDQATHEDFYSQLEDDLTLYKEAATWFRRENTSDRTTPYSLPFMPAKRTLYAFQMFGAYFVFQTQIFFSLAVLGDVPGLGKTTQAYVLTAIYAYVHYAWDDFQAHPEQHLSPNFNPPDIRQAFSTKCAFEKKNKLPFACPCSKLFPKWLYFALKHDLVPKGPHIYIVPQACVVNACLEFANVFDSRKNNLGIKLLVAHEESSKVVANGNMPNVRKFNTEMIKECLTNQEDDSTSKQCRNIIISSMHSWNSKLLRAADTEGRRLAKLKGWKLNIQTRKGWKDRLYIKPATVICDEFHQRTGNDSSIARELFSLGPFANSNILAMSGTPFPTNFSGIKLWIKAAELRNNRRKRSRLEYLQDLDECISSRIEECIPHLTERNMDNIVELSKKSRSKKFQKLQNLATSVQREREVWRIVMVRRTEDTSFDNINSIVPLPPLHFEQPIVEPYSKVILEKINQALDWRSEIKKATAEHIHLQTRATKNRSGQQSNTNTVVMNTAAKKLSSLRPYATFPFLIDMRKSGYFKLPTAVDLMEHVDKNDEIPWNPFISPGNNIFSKHAKELMDSSSRFNHIYKTIKKAISEEEKSYVFPGQNLANKEQQKRRTVKFLIMSQFPVTAVCIYECLIYMLEQDPHFRTADGRIPVIGNYYSQTVPKIKNATLDGFRDRVKLDSNGRPKIIMERGKPVPDYVQKIRPDILVGTTRTLGTGIDLPRASFVIISEPQSRQSEVIQNIKRAHRVGQQFVCFAQELRSEDIDVEKMIISVAKFKAEIESIIQDSKSWTTEEIQEHLRLPKSELDKVREDTQTKLREQTPDNLLNWESYLDYNYDPQGLFDDSVY